MVWQQFNRILEKSLPFITPVSVFLGVVLSTYINDFLFLVPWLFAFMTFEGSLTMNIRSMKNVLIHPVPIFIIIGFLHIAMPLWALVVGHVAFQGDNFTITGLILSMVIPTGVTSFIWVAMKNGNSSLTLAVILIDSLLSPLFVPFSLSLLIGEQVVIDSYGMMVGLFYMIVLPSIVGMIVNECTKGKAKTFLKPKLMPFSKIFLGCVVMLNASVIAPYFDEINSKLFFVISTVLLLSFTSYFFAFLLGKLLKCNQELLVSLTFTGGMRNISAGAVIAVSYFPSAVVFPVVVGMLFQQVMASIFGIILDHHKKTLETSKRVRI